MKFYLLGLFAGDGWFQTRGIAIGTNSINFASKIEKTCLNVFGKCKVKKRIYPDGHKMYILYVWRKDVCDEFKILLKTEKNKSKTFRVPKMELQFQRQFVAGIFDAEATSYLWKNKPRVGMELHNEMAAKEICEILRADGIKCYFSKCSRGEFKLDFTGKENVNKFFQNYHAFRLAPSSTG